MLGKLVLLVLLSTQAAIGDWSRFRGTNGSGNSAGQEPPVQWSPTENMVWKTILPGHGSSSPVIAGDNVFVTCYSGYGLDREDPGEMQNLRLHLLCLARSNGQLIWERKIPARLPEREYTGYMIHHGYASATPVADGNAVFAFFGRSGGCAFDHDGKPLWTIDLGDKTHEFGTGGSPILVDDMVIFNATIESGALVAVNKVTGEEMWRTEKLPASWATPAVLQLGGDGRRELVFNVAKRVYGFDPQDGKKLWECAYGGDVAFGSVTVDSDVVYVSGGNSRKATAAIRGGGRGDVTDTHLLWQIEKASKIPTLLIHDQLLYCIGDGGIARCLQPETGEILYEKRLPRMYPWSSAIAVDRKIFVTGTRGRVLILKAGAAYKELAINKTADSGRFNATPAVDRGRLLIRSKNCVYCVANE